MKKGARQSDPAADTHSARIEWIDVVRGIAIALVVYGHVMQGAAASGTIAAGRFFKFSDAFVYSFHMPAFFFVSGLLSARALGGPVGRYLRAKAETIAWPYLVWTLLGNASFLLFARFYHHPPADDPLRQILTCLWNPGGFWFLHTLFCVQVFTLLAVWTGLDFVVVLALGGFFLAGMAATIPALEKFLFFLPFFVLGAREGGRLGEIFSHPRWPLPVALAIFLGQAALVESRAESWPACRLVLGFAGTFGLIALAAAMHGTWLARAWARVVAASLGVFLLHPYIQGAIRTGLQKAFHLDNAFAVVLEIAGATLIPVFLYEWLLRGPGRLLFTLRPERKSGAPAPAQRPLAES